MKFNKIIATSVISTLAVAQQPPINASDIKLSDPIIYEDDVVAIPENIVCVPGPGSPCEIKAQLVTESTTSLVKGLLKTAVPATISHVAYRTLNSIGNLVESELLGLLDSNEENTYLKRIAIKGHDLTEDFEAIIGYHTNRALGKHVFLALRGLGVDSDRVALFLPEDEETFLGEEEEETSVFEEVKETLKDMGFRSLINKLELLGELNHQLESIKNLDNPSTKYALRSIPITGKINAYFNTAQIQTYPDGLARPSYLKRIETFARLFKAYFSQREEDRTVEIQTLDVGLDDITVEQSHELMVDIAGVLASF